MHTCYVLVADTTENGPSNKSSDDANNQDPIDTQIDNDVSTNGDANKEDPDKQIGNDISSSGKYSNVTTLFQYSEYKSYIFISIFTIHSGNAAWAFGILSE
jgi:hypothetical protein